MRTGSTESATAILKEPLFLNPEIITEDKPLIFTDWIAAGITRIRDICYEVIPGYLPVSAIHDMLIDKNPRTLSRTTEKLRAICCSSPTMVPKDLYRHSLAAAYLATLFWHCELKPWTNTHRYFIVQDASFLHTLAVSREACYPCCRPLEVETSTRILL